MPKKNKVTPFQTEKSRKKDKKLGGLDRRLLRLANRKKKALDFYPRAKGSKPARRKERAATRFQKTLTKRNRRSPLFNESGEKKRKISSTTRTLNRKIKTFQKRKSSYSRAIAHGKAASAEYKATGKVTAKGKRELWKMAKEGERLARQVTREKRIKKRIKK